MTHRTELPPIALRTARCFRSSLPSTEAGIHFLIMLLLF